MLMTHAEQVKATKDRHDLEELEQLIDQPGYLGIAARALRAIKMRRLHAWGVRMLGEKAGDRRK